MRIAGGICRQLARRMNIDSGVGWAQAAAHACSMLTPDDVDIILATGSPFASFGLAKHLSVKLGRPYVLDYRDPWTGNPHVAGSVPQAVVRQEAQLLNDASAITIVSPSWMASLQSRFQVGDKLHVITNGYDPEELQGITPYDFGHFAIVYAGNFYPPKRVISPVFAALKRFGNGQDTCRKEWYFHYYGEQEAHIREEASRFGIMERVVLHGTVPRSQVLSAVRGASVTVVITSVDQKSTVEDNGIVPGKVFETLGLGAPMLLITPPDSDVGRITDRVGLGRGYSGNDIEGITGFLTEAMHENLPMPGRQSMYAWPNIAKNLDTILRTVVEGHTCV